MASNGRYALLVFLLGISHAEAFVCAIAGPFRRRANTQIQQHDIVRELNSRPAAPTTTTCFDSPRGVSDASPRFEAEQGVLPPHFRSADSVAWVQLMLDSFEETFGDGQPLIRGLDREASSPEEQARQVALADVAVVSHDFLRSADDPLFVYGNEAGLRTFGYTWVEFTALPSRKSAEEDVRAERAELLQNVREFDKTASAVDVSGVRVTKTGERLKISAAVWNVKDAGGHTVGQAARVTVLD